MARRNDPYAKLTDEDWRVWAAFLFEIKEEGDEVCRELGWQPRKIKGFPRQQCPEPETS